MDSADSFMNWGFNPKQGSNKKPYYLIYGGANPDDGEPYAGFAQFETLQSVLKGLWEVWDSFESWKMDDVMEWIEEEGQGLTLFQGDNYGATFPEILFLTNKYPYYAWKPASVIQKDILPIKTPIVGLTHTSGWLGEGETGSQFLKRVKNEYETYIDKSTTIKDYANKLESITIDELFPGGSNSLYRWHQFYPILEMKYNSEWNIETMKVVYAP